MFSMLQELAHMLEHHLVPNISDYLIAMNTSSTKSSLTKEPGNPYQQCSFWFIGKATTILQTPGNPGNPYVTLLHSTLIFVPINSISTSLQCIVFLPQAHRIIQPIYKHSFTPPTSKSITLFQRCKSGNRTLQQQLI